MGLAFNMMVGIGITFLIFGVFVFLEADATKNLQVRPNNSEQIDLSDLSTNVGMSVCNPTFIPTSFDRIDGELFYKSTSLGTFTVYGNTAFPGINEAVGKLNFHGRNVLEIIDSAAQENSSSTMPDGNHLSITIIFEKSILGTAPFYVEKYYRGSDFTAFWEGKSDEWDCADSSSVDFFSQISSQAKDQGKAFSEFGEKTLEGASKAFP